MTTTVELLEAAWVQVDRGCDLLDTSNVVQADISSELGRGGRIDSVVARTIHRTCILPLAELDWGKARVRPWFSVWNGIDAEPTRWNMGVYSLDTPERRSGRTPAIYVAQGYDLLQLLNAPYGASYSLASGSVVLTAVASLLSGFGVTSRISQVGIASTLAAARVWPIDQKTTRLKIVNELLAMIGYSPLWVDRDGYWRAQPLVNLATASPVWAYNADSATTTVGVDVSLQADVFEVPNQWVCVRDDPSLTSWAEGAGIYTVTNAANGPSSVAGRGRTIPEVVKITAVSQDALVAQGDVYAANAQRPVATLSVEVAPNPVHWHEEIVTYSDARIGATGLWVVKEWSLSLDGGNMKLKLGRV